MKITLNSLSDPARPIAAIKALRDATRPPGTGSVGVMSLRDAKHAVDAVAAATPRPQTVEIRDNPHLGSLRAHFDLTVNVPGGLDRRAVSGLLLDILSEADPATAHAIRALPSFERVQAALIAELPAKT